MICPKCKGKNIIKYGRSNHNQLYFCKICKKKITANPLKNKSYSPQVIINAISYYNLGNSLIDTTKKVNRRFKVKVSKSTVHTWIHEFSDICTYHKIRDKIGHQYPGNIIHEYKFQHSGLSYNFCYHIPKVDIISRKFPSIVYYLHSMEKRCPSDIFKENSRCSQLNLDNNIQTKKRYNQACRLSDLALKACKNNKERHHIVGHFMLINDEATIACEIPVWFWEKNMNEGICGHIDLLQIRNGKIYVLDFKPNAKKEKQSKVISQLYLYAQGLSFRTKLPLDMFLCAWFDNESYFEFSPTQMHRTEINRV